MRDKHFREKYPDVRLELILKADYKLIEGDYKELIAEWES